MIAKLDKFLLNLAQTYVNFRHNHDGDAYLETAEVFKWIGLPVAVMTLFFGLYQKSIFLGLLTTAVIVGNCYFPNTAIFIKCLKFKSAKGISIMPFAARLNNWVYAIDILFIYFVALIAQENDPNLWVWKISFAASTPMCGYMWFVFYYLMRTNKPLNKTKREVKCGKMVLMGT